MLGTIAFGLDALLEREIGAPPELDAQSARHRLLRVIGDVAARARDPVLLLFEDLQWADPNSFALLAQVSAGAGGLAVRDDRWRFDHDKLRERVLAEISPPDLRALHAQVAEGLLETYAESFEHAASIAHHFHEGGCATRTRRCGNSARTWASRCQRARSSGAGRR